jgi:hypothetical protein
MWRKYAGPESFEASTVVDKKKKRGRLLQPCCRNIDIFRRIEDKILLPKRFARTVKMLKGLLGGNKKKDDWKSNLDTLQSRPATLARSASMSAPVDNKVRGQKMVTYAADSISQ